MNTCGRNSYDDPDNPGAKIVVCAECGKTTRVWTNSASPNKTLYWPPEPCGRCSGGHASRSESVPPAFRDFLDGLE